VGMRTRKEGVQKGKNKRKNYNFRVAIRKSLKVIKINEISNEIMEIKLEYNRNRWRIVTIARR